MRIAVVGPGALGCFFAARLALRPCHEVWLLDHDKERADYLASHGLRLLEGKETLSAKVRVSLHPEEVGRADLVLLCVKSHHVPLVLEQIRPLASHDNLLIALQNGIAHHRVLQEGYHGRWAIGVTAQGAALEGSGIVRHGGDGNTFIGFFSPEKQASKVLGEMTQVFGDAGIQTSLSHDIRNQVWRKFIVNVGINALSVILDCPNGHIIESDTGRERLKRAVEEAVCVAVSKEIDVGQDMVAITEKVCEATAINISSMLQDVRRQTKTEIDAINGALIQEAKMVGIPVPENEKLVREVQYIESRYLSN